MIIAREILIKGRVQGVFYRKSAHEKAKKIGLTGYVKNQPDGSVFCLAQGEEAEVDLFARWCAIGPPMAKVTAVEVTEAEIDNGLKTFSIK